MRLMMLHANYRQAGFLGPMRRRVVRVKVADNCFRLETVEAAKIVDCAFEGVPGLKRLEVTDVLAEKDVSPDCDGNRVLEMPPDGEHRRQFSAHTNSQGG